MLIADYFLLYMRQFSHGFQCVYSGFEIPKTLSTDHGAGRQHFSIHRDLKTSGSGK